MSIREEIEAAKLAGDFITIEGGVPLRGEITVRGAKNFVSKAMVASLLASKKGETVSVLRNVPKIRDVEVVSKLLELHGAKVDVDVEKGQVTIDVGHLSQPEIADVDTLAGSSRIPILFCGPLLHRLGEAFIPSLGGCNIGGRPLDFHFDALRQFGATIEKTKGGVKISAPNGLKGVKIKLPYPSVGATEQILLTAVLAKGKTELKNAAIEPEIMDEIDVLQKMGAIISVDTDRVIHIEGVEELKGYNHFSLPDRIEAGSWACAALSTKGDVFIKGAQQSDMSTFLNMFRKIGGEFDIKDDGIRFYYSPDNRSHSIALETAVHPGFMTDWQQPFVVALTQVEGLSIVHETVYENRLGFTEALNLMGAQIQLYKECLGSKACRFAERNFEHSAAIVGPTKLQGAEILVPDLRGGFSYLIAALTAEGKSTVYGISLIDRGYEMFRDKLTALGANFK
ncbi:MAG: UDP-N-acetylglucosamine 1-carboxyvinyltransferase [Candidatus Ancillula sp.]|jgi:UDP-N-acetylglucosamine 1-carboxyvinyltransferase|nr:UDP-N-acetylglucosamine 1-carboxyvinyltransferase [Candidatus Ancillula sp.]